MPGGDRTGPMGQGAMSGRAAVYCGGYHQRGWMSRMMGRWFGGGERGGWQGHGRGFRHGFRMTGMPGWQRAAFGMTPWAGQGPVPIQQPIEAGPAPDQELAWLKQHAGHLESELKSIQGRMAELTKAEPQ